MSKLILSKLSTATLIAITTMGLAACGKGIILLDDGGKVAGKLEVTASFPSPAHLTIDGKEYTGHWNVEKIYEENLAKSRRLMGEHAYFEYEIGEDPKQLKHGHADLTADDGSKIQCDFYYRSQPRDGSCNMDGKQLHLTVQ